ncbi:unnamed protein product [Phytomonas sp. EM1]|nr:unnamed protein product [Phytomonas sp. EM1]|eukprot:CCW65561.1 unnamed protein product [Phytomonas sp. isolate EM1]
MIIPCHWDHKTLPYKPAQPSLIFYLIPDDPVPRVFLPNARGEYYNLVPGLPYMELSELEPVYLLEYAPPSLVVDAATQT